MDKYIGQHYKPYVYEQLRREQELSAQSEQTSSQHTEHIQVKNTISSLPTEILVNKTDINHAKPVKKRKIHIFSITLLVLFSASLVFYTFVWKYLWGYLESFQKTDQTDIIYTAEEQIKQYSADEFLDKIAIETDKYNTKEDYSIYFKKKYGESLLSATFIKKRSDKKSAEYSIYLNGTEIGCFNIFTDGKPDKFNNEGWDFSISGNPDIFIPEYGVKIDLPRKCTIKANDLTISPKFLTPNIYKIKEFNVLNDESLQPEYVVYDTGKIFLNDPEISVFSPDGELMNLKRENQEYTAYYPISDEKLKEIQDFCENYSVTYAKYITKDLNFDSLTEFLYKDSEYYKRVRAYWNEYYRQHEITYDNVTFSEPKIYDPDHVVIDISFDYYVVLSYQTNNYHCDYTLCLLNTDDGWKIASMEL